MEDILLSFSSRSLNMASRGCYSDVIPLQQPRLWIVLMCLHFYHSLSFLFWEFTPTSNISSHPWQMRKAPVVGGVKDVPGSQDIKIKWNLDCSWNLCSVTQLVPKGDRIWHSRAATCDLRANGFEWWRSKLKMELGCGPNGAWSVLSSPGPFTQTAVCIQLGLHFVSGCRCRPPPVHTWFWPWQKEHLDVLTQADW